ncbi:hypothetical protein D0Y65_039042 [Glycine soja]|uniref:Uncharacterized protein n=1 Tax=Glycine soja TaxID=3848 RepID=A0A445H761_GLYSO|nr:hypothetical protein D0Y65_039042 [Glycine soja]
MGGCGRPQRGRRGGRQWRPFSGAFSVHGRSIAGGVKGGNSGSWMAVGFTFDVLENQVNLRRNGLGSKNWRPQSHAQKLIYVIEFQWNILQSHIQESHDFTELVSVSLDFTNFLGHWFCVEDTGKYHEALLAILLEY